MRHRLLLASLGLILVAFGLLQQGWYWFAVWFGIDFLIVAMAHAAGWHGIFGKRPDGTLPLWSWILFLPLLLYTQLVWHLLRWLSREPPHHAINDHLVVGRRLLPGEPASEFDNYVDLTAEFVEPASIRRAPAYHSFPILDAGAPDPKILLREIQRLKPGKTFIHCAQGHGRTGLFALALLLHSGQVRSIEEGLRQLCARRAGICLNSTQRRCLEQFVRSLRPS